MFALVASQPRGRFEFSARLFLAAELMEEIASNARQQVIALERRLAREAVHDRQRDCRSFGNANGDRAVEFDDGRGHYRHQFRIEF
jgi:hypothetical protein